MAPMVAKNAPYNPKPNTKYNTPHPSMTGHWMSRRKARSSWEDSTVWKSTASAERPWVWAQLSIQSLCSTPRPNKRNSTQLSNTQASIWAMPTKPMPTILPANS